MIDDLERRYAALLARLESVRRGYVATMRAALVLAEAVVLLEDGSVSDEVYALAGDLADPVDGLAPVLRKAEHEIRISSGEWDR